MDIQIDTAGFFHQNTENWSIKSIKEMQRPTGCLCFLGHETMAMVPWLMFRAKKKQININ